MTGPSSKPPRTVDQATARLARYAELAGQLADVQARRKADIGRVNASADAQANPLIAELEKLAEQLSGWWNAGGQELAPSGRKSLQLGGCIIGTRASRPTLAHGFESDEKAVEALLATRYAKHTTRVKYSLDRTATLKLLQVGGKTGQTIAELGFTIEQGEQFYIERVEQEGTRP